ncbi:hypothetical protein [Acidianus brierleyi]|uniref:hypothetical protein n=1 Tax=Acidianus brierleyi TaxID=41673 RepID=UPI00144314AC|nr:hypothetical protein [Acidianus brierleyi]AWR94879.2 hypothetical protein DFR85_09990 [Acidianus brierleyi]
MISRIYLNGDLETSKNILRKNLQELKRSLEINGYKVNFLILRNLYNIVLAKDGNLSSLLIFLRDFKDYAIVDIFTENLKNNSDLYKIIEGDIKSWNQ